jgi:hypothetical protein
MSLWISNTNFSPPVSISSDRSLPGDLYCNMLGGVYIVSVIHGHIFLYWTLDFFATYLLPFSVTLYSGALTNSQLQSRVLSISQSLSHILLLHLRSNTWLIANWSGFMLNDCHQVNIILRLTASRPVVQSILVSGHHLERATISSFSSMEFFFRHLRVFFIMGHLLQRQPDLSSFSQRLQ